jgi:hypothetical protein
MTSINDFATTYMCQSLPFGGVKHSGFDRFAGIEGLRGMCIPKAVAEDRWPFKTAIPPLLQYPVSDRAFDFVSSLVWMFYAPGWAGEGAAGCCCCSVKCRAVQCSTRAWRVNTRLVHAWGGARGVSCCGVQAT